MIKSMTGFASLTHETEQATIAVSVKTVNHRFLDLQVRLSQMIAELEPRVRQLVQQHVSRGRVDVNVSVQLRTPPAPTVELNAEFTAALASAVEAARATGLVSGPLTPGDLLRMPQALVVRDRSVALDALAAAESAAGIEAALSQALREMDVMRSHEGDHLRTDLGSAAVTGSATWPNASAPPPSWGAPAWKPGSWSASASCAWRRRPTRRSWRRRWCARRPGPTCPRR